MQPCVVACFGFLAILTSALAQLQPEPAAPDSALTLNDLVVSFGTTFQDGHTSVARSTRSWRKGVRAIIAQNQPVSAELEEEGASHRETFLEYADQPPGFSQYTGDARAALAPFLAARHVGPDNFKWILYGDDDTIWFLSGVLRLLERFDPEVPYIITDGFYWHNWGRPAAPNFLEDGPPRCLPCHFNQSVYQPRPGALFTPPIGCPCTPQLVCAHDRRNILDKSCSFPVASMWHYWDGPLYSLDGGAGAIMSAGLFKSLNFDAVEQCITTSHGSGSDHIFSYCMWNMGYAMTLPDSNMMPTGEWTARMFTTFERIDTMIRLIWAAEGSEKCDAACEHQLLTLVSAHIKSRSMKSLQAAALLIRAFSELYDAFLASQGQQPHQLTAGRPSPQHIVGKNATTPMQ